MLMVQHGHASSNFCFLEAKLRGCRSPLAELRQCVYVLFTTDLMYMQSSFSDVNHETSLCQKATTHEDLSSKRRANRGKLDTAVDIQGVVAVNIQRRQTKIGTTLMQARRHWGTRSRSSLLGSVAWLDIASRCLSAISRL